MTGAKVTIDIDAREVTTAITRMIQLGEQPNKMLEEIGFRLVQHAQDRFFEGSGPDGEAWPVSIRAREEGGRTLLKSNDLMGSLNYNANNSYVEYGTNSVYGAIHQFGGTIKAKSAGALKFKIGDRFSTKKSVEIPARPYLGFSKEDEHMIEDMIGQFIDQATRV